MLKCCHLTASLVYHREILEGIKEEELFYSLTQNLESFLVKHGFTDIITEPRLRTMITTICRKRVAKNAGQKLSIIIPVYNELSTLNSAASAVISKNINGVPVNYFSRSYTEGRKVSMIRDPKSWIRGLIKYRFCRLMKDTC